MMLRNVLSNIIKISSIVTILSSTVHAEEHMQRGQVTGLSIPRFVSLKSSESNLRKGPNVKYPIVWTFHQKGYPMEVIAEFENWRKLKDIDGEEGWVHTNLVTGIRNVMISNNKYQTPNEDYEARNRELVLFRYPDEASYPMLRLELGVIAALKSCNIEWCKIKVSDTSGWVRKENLWGIYQQEIIE